MLRLAVALVAALLGYLVLRAYRDPAMVIDLTRAFVLC
jgi:hypothetical protein